MEAERMIILSGTRVGIGFLVCAALGIAPLAGAEVGPSGTSGTPAGKGVRAGAPAVMSVSEASALLSAFRDSLSRWKDLPEAGRVQRTRLLFQPYGVDELQNLARSAGKNEQAAVWPGTFSRPNSRGNPSPPGNSVC